MFKILQKTFKTGIATVEYPAAAARVSQHFRGRPDFDFDPWRDARPAAEACPTGAISLDESRQSRKVTVDYGLCIYCGQCADASTDGSVRMTSEFELATRERESLVRAVEYTLTPDGEHERLVSERIPPADTGARLTNAIRR